MVIYHRLTTFGNLFTEKTVQRFIYTLRPTPYRLGPLLYGCLLLRSALALSLELAESLRSICICAIFCSRE